MKLLLPLLLLAAAAVPAMAQRTSYSGEYMAKVMQYDRFTVLKQVAADPATGEVTIIFDRFWRDNPCYSLESWQRYAVDNRGTQYDYSKIMSVPTFKGMWTRATFTGTDGFVVAKGATSLSRLTLSSRWCSSGSDDEPSWSNIDIRWKPYDTLYPAWSAEAYASGRYFCEGTPALPYTGRTECIQSHSDYVPLRLTGVVGNRQTGLVTLVLSAHALRGGEHSLTIEQITAFDDDGNAYEKDYGYNADENTLVTDIDRELRCLTFQVPITATSFQRIEFKCKVGSFDYIKYRCDDVPIHWVSPAN